MRYITLQSDILTVVQENSNCRWFWLSARAKKPRDMHAAKVSAVNKVANDQLQSFCYSDTAHCGWNMEWNLNSRSFCTYTQYCQLHHSSIHLAGKTFLASHAPSSLNVAPNNGMKWHWPCLQLRCEGITAGGLKWHCIVNCHFL